MKTKRNTIIAFIALFLISMVIQITVDNAANYYDAAGYWALGKTCGWDVRNITSEYRGWVLPYIFSMCYKLGMVFGKEFLGYWIFSSLIFAFTFSFSFATIAGILGFEGNDNGIICAGGICGIIFYIFFRGLFIYTLSDFWAFSFSLFSVILAHKLITQEHEWYKEVLEAFLGLCLYGTYNIRTIYQFFAVGCIIIMIIAQICKKKWKKIAITLPGCFLGMIVCAIPQIILNHQIVGKSSWKVLTGDLMLFQLFCGASTGRYATYVGEESQYGAAGMYFIDRIGQTILERAGLTELVSYGQVIKLFLSHPLDFGGIYARHLINMLYPVYPNQYILDITKDKSLLLLLFYTIFFIAAFNFVYTIKLKKEKWIWLFLILLPCICILPGAVEIRFFIALHFMIYMYAVLGVKQFVISFREHKVQFIMLYLAGFFCYLAYAGMLLASTEAGIAIIN